MPDEFKPIDLPDDDDPDDPANAPVHESPGAPPYPRPPVVEPGLHVDPGEAEPEPEAEDSD